VTVGFGFNIMFHYILKLVQSPAWGAIGLREQQHENELGKVGWHGCDGNGGVEKLAFILGRHGGRLNGSMVCYFIGVSIASIPSIENIARRLQLGFYLWKPAQEGWEV
jgi:hypothetical protein